MELSLEGLIQREAKKAAIAPRVRAMATKTGLFTACGLKDLLL
jgi:hypothetical protein